MRKRLTVLSALLLTALVSTVPAHADSGPGPVKFVPLRVAPHPGVLKPGAVRHHTLVVVPLYVAVSPDIATMRQMGAKAKAFWESQVPGLRLTVKFLRPHHYASACSRTVNGAWTTSVNLARINPYATGNHVLAYAPECRLNGLGSQRNGSGMIFIGLPDADGSTLAHEFGHNLGLLHANALGCKVDGKPISLSRQCTESEYADWTSVMGNGPLDEWVRVGGLGQALLTGRVRTIDPRRGGTVTLSATRRGLQAASLKTSLGVIYFSTFNSSRLNPASAIEAAVATRRGSGGVLFPEVADRSTIADGLLELGTHWDIPGTALRATVIAADATSATVVFGPRTPAGPPPAPATVTMPAYGQFPADLPWTLAWTPSPSEGIVAYFVQDQSGSIIARTSGAVSQAVLDAGAVDIASDDAGEYADLTVVAVGRDGSKSTSAPVRVTPVFADLTLTSSNGPNDEVVVTTPFTLSWSITAMYGPAVSSWVVEYAGQETTVPGSQTSIIIDPNLDPDPEQGEVRVTARDAHGGTIASARYTFYKIDWWS